MIKTLILTVAAVFACLGICDFLHTVKLFLLFPGIKTSSYCVVFLKGDYAIDQLRYLADKHRWYGDEYCGRIIAVADDLSDTQIAACERFCYGLNIYLCRFENIGPVINSFEVGEFDEK